MTSPGLDNRLRQHGRRAGLMVGLSMALTIAVCIGGFVWIYAQAEPFTKDFVDAATAAPTRENQSNNDEKSTAEPTDAAGDEVASGNSDQPQSEPTNEPEPTSTPESFQATHRVSSEVTINFRPGPGVNSGEPIGQLSPGTELQSLNETEQSQDPDADGDTTWLRFRTQDGLEGWIRQIDVEPINSGQ
jgi:cytoskeletal protein RodZ